MVIYTDLINGFCFGFELFDDGVDSGIAIDLGILRLFFIKDKYES